MGRNPDWHAQIRARGLCILCRRPMRDDDPHLAHRECYREQYRGRRCAEIRTAPPALDEQLNAKGVA
jgi:hypothetical protein